MQTPPMLIEYVVNIVALFSMLIMLFMMFVMSSFRPFEDPANVFYAFWIGWVLLSIALHSILPVAWEGLAWILFQIIVFFMGGALGAATSRTITTRNLHSKKQFTIRPVRARNVLLVCLFLGLVANYAYFRQALKDGITVDIYNPLSIFKVTYYYTVNTYGNNPGWRPPEQATFFSTFIYLGALLGGVFLSSSEKKISKWLAFSCFFPATGNLLLVGKRNSILLPMILFGCSWLAGRVQRKKYKSERIGTGKSVISLIFFIVIMFFVIITARVFRSNEERIESFTESIEHDTGNTIDTIFAPISNFSNWFAHNLGKSFKLGLGRYSFRGPTGWLGMGERLYFESNLPIVYSKSNIYTVFRELIADFGFIGIIFFMLWVSFLGGYSFSSVQGGSVGFVPLLTGVYAFIMYSILGNIFTHTVTCLAWFLFLFISHFLLEIRGTSRAQHVL